MDLVADEGQTEDIVRKHSDFIHGQFTWVKSRSIRTPLPVENPQDMTEEEYNLSTSITKDYQDTCISTL